VTGVSGILTIRIRIYLARLSVPPDLFATSTITTATVIELVGSFVSITLAGFAIWQASMFYRWGARAANESHEAARALESSVKKLEELFDRFYSDTFGMVRDTFSDFRKHAWAEDGDGKHAEADDALAEVEKRAAAKVADLRLEMMGEVGDLVQKLGATTSQVTEMEDRLGQVVDRAIAGSREAENEAIEATIRDRLLDRLASLRATGRTNVDADDLIGGFRSEFDFPDVIRQLEKLRDGDIVSWHGPLGPSTDVRLTSGRRVRRSRPTESSAGSQDQGNGDSE
jgi:hypothetical protein